MTAIPGPPLSRLEQNEDAKLFEDSAIKKSLTNAFDTPAVVKKRVSRLSQNFQQLPAEFIKVFLRLRPFTEKELKENEDQKCMKISEDHHILTVMAPKDSRTFKASNRGIGESVRHYTFTKIFDPTAGQKAFYQETAHPLVQQFIEGNNGLIFTYGVTNAGKTYTLQGTTGNEGIIPQSIDVIFDQIGDQMLENVNFVPKMATNLCFISDDEMKTRDAIKEEVLSMASESRYSVGQRSQTTLESTEIGDALEVNQTDISPNTTKVENTDNCMETDQVKGPVKYAVFVSFVEVYRELVYDLLVPVSEDKRRSRRVLVIADDKKGTAYVKGMREIQINTPEELLKVLSVGQRNLHVAATKLNKDSSRSHCIFTITLVQVMDIPEPHGGRVSKISFCDLAGSERANKTGEAGDRLKEAGKINNSLMKLGMCISDLRYNQKFKDDKSKQKTISFRESKLTRLFRNYLLGDGRACMIVNANMCASGFDENIHVLKFSALAKEVQVINKAKRSEIIRSKSRSTESEAAFQNAMQRSSRATIAWERKLSPVKDVEEEEDPEEEDVSDSDSDEYEETVQYDISFWQNREKKFLELIDMLKKGLIAEKKKRKEQEAAIREEFADFFHNQIVDIEQKHKDHVEDTIEVLTDEQKVRVEVMANLANLNMEELKEGFDKKIWELTTKHAAVEKELNDFREQANAKAMELLSAEEKLTTFQLEVNALKMELEVKQKELVAARRKTSRSSRCSGGADDRDSMVKELLEENEEGKAIIRSLMEEVEEYRSRVENTQDECEKLREELSDATKEKEARSEQSSSADNDKVELLELRKSLEEISQQVSDLEQTATDLVEGAEIFGQEISVDEDKPLKNAEGILRFLPEFLQRKQDHIAQIGSDFEKEVKDHSSTKHRLAATTALLQEATVKVDTLTSDLDDKKKEFENILMERDKMEISLKEKAELVNQEKDAMKTTLEEKIEDLGQKLKAAEQESSEELSSTRDKLKNLENEVKEKSDFEQKLMKETDRLHGEVERLKMENLKVEQTCLKRTSDASDMLRDVEILTRDRNDLAERVENLRKKLTEVTKEKDDLKEKLRENIANTTTVQSTTELLELKDALHKKEKEVEKLTCEKDALSSVRSDLENQISSFQVKLDEVEKVREEEKTRYLSENEECQSLVSQMKESTQKLNDEIENLHEESKSLVREREDLTKLVDGLKEELKTSQEGITELENKLEKTCQEHAEEKDWLRQSQEELEAELVPLQTKLEVLEKQKELYTIQRKEFEEENSDLEEELSKTQKELNIAKATFTAFKDKTTEHLEQLKKDHETEVKSVKDGHISEIKVIKSELTQCRKTAKNREKELANFRENRDRIVAALEVQIKNDKATNEILKTNLDEQIAENVKLKSQNAAASAELSELIKLSKGDANRRMRKSTSASAVLSTVSVNVKREPLSPHSEEGYSPNEQSQDDMPLKNTENKLQSPTANEASGERTRTSGRTTRGRKRGSSTGSRGGSKRGKRATTRPATPLPEEQPEEDEDHTSPVKVARTSSRACKRGAAVRMKSEQLVSGQEVLDDSALLKETGNAREFPQTTLEIDVTPNLSKKALKQRKRAAKKEDQENESEDAEVGLANTRSFRRKTRLNSNNSNSVKTTDEENESAPVSGTKNLTKVGSMIRNSPVGHALKCIEEAISPASKSPKKTRRQPEEQNKRTRRLVRLHPDDISSPLEATPSPESIRDPPSHPPVSDTPSRMMRRLRNRK